MGSTKTRVYELICQEWVERERGWGMRPDGFTLYMNKEDWKKHIDSFNAERQASIDANPGFVPDEYTQVDGDPFRVRVPKDIYDQVKKTNGGHIWGKGNSCHYERTV